MFHNDRFLVNRKRAQLSTTPSSQPLWTDYAFYHFKPVVAIKASKIIRLVLLIRPHIRFYGIVKFIQPRENLTNAFVGFTPTISIMNQITFCVQLHTLLAIAVRSGRNIPVKSFFNASTQTIIVTPFSLLSKCSLSLFSPKGMSVF